MTQTVHAAEKEFHDQFYAHEAEAILRNPLHNRKRRQVVRRLTRLLPDPSRRDLLSLGCGDGDTEVLAAEHFRRVVGVDISAVAIEKARQRAAVAERCNLEFQEGDCTDPASLPGHDQYDMICALGFLHHLSDTDVVSLLRSSLHRLRPGGVFVSTDPNRYRAVGLLKWTVSGLYRKHHSPDEREIRPSHLAKLYETAGYQEARVSYIDFLVGPAAWVFPRTPAWLAAPVVGINNVLVATPLIRRFASNFMTVARKPSEE